MNTSPALYRHGQVLTDLLPVLIEEVVQKVSMLLSALTLSLHPAASYHTAWHVVSTLGAVCHRNSAISQVAGVHLQGLCPLAASGVAVSIKVLYMSGVCVCTVFCAAESKLHNCLSRITRIIVLAEPRSELGCGAFSSTCTQTPAVLVPGSHNKHPAWSPTLHTQCMQAIDPCFPAPSAEAAAVIKPLSGFDVLIDTPSGRNMRRTISGSGRGAYNSTMAAAARAVRKTSSNSGNPDAAVARSNSNTSSSSAAVATGSGSGSGDDDESAAMDRSLQKTSRANADDSISTASHAAPAASSDGLKPGNSVSKPLMKTGSSSAAAAVYQQNLVIRTMRKTNSGLAAGRAAFKV